MASKNEKAGRQPVTDCNCLGNAAKMREALNEISQEIWESIDPFCNDDCCKPKRELAKIADAALAEPPRNCDRPECSTTKAAQEVWRKEDGGQDGVLRMATRSIYEGRSEMSRSNFDKPFGNAAKMEEGENP